MAVTSLPLPAFAADAAAGEEIAISAERFPDEQFRNYISEQLDSDGDNMLSATECSEVVDLNVSQQGIADLTGIDVFSKLQQLDCSGNTLSALDISGAAQLLQLNCSANPDLSALKLPEKNGAFSFLVMLDCSDCALTELSLDSYALLGTLDCSGNQLAALDISANSNLRTVDCSGNQLTTLDVSANSNLQTVNCSNNQLATLDVSANSNLQTVDCSGNQLTTLDVSANSNLQTVNCSNNQLAALDVSANSNLQTVNCSNNQLTTLNFSQNAKLEEVDCSGNQLTELDVYNAHCSSETGPLGKCPAVPVPVGVFCSPRTGLFPEPAGGTGHHRTDAGMFRKLLAISVPLCRSRNGRERTAMT